MSADFWAGYISGAAGIVIGNPLDVLKVRLQAGGKQSNASLQTVPRQLESASALIRGVTAPIVGYGALNAILFVTYNRALAALGDTPGLPLYAWKIWTAGAVGGLATFLVSAPTELIKCRTQLSINNESSWSITKQLWRTGGLRALYLGGCITSVRDAVGYGFYFWSYELSKQTIVSGDDTERQAAVKILMCGGLAGVVTWASIFPLDVIKTRVQTQEMLLSSEVNPLSEQRSLLSPDNTSPTRKGITRLSTIEIARQAYVNEGLSVFFRGLGVCSLRAFIVNAVQWAVYEWAMRVIT